MRFFVTGGSRGIGAAIVRGAVAAGHEVAFTYVRDEEAAARVAADTRGTRPAAVCRPYRLDVGRPDDVEQVVSRVADDLGSLDVVVSNAGINRNALAVTMSNEDWHDVIRTNLTGAFYVARQCLPLLLEKRFGRLVFVSSISRGGLTGQANYAASKAGLVGLSRALAKEYGARGITSNVVAPGIVETDMTKEHLSARQREFWLGHCPQRRFGVAEDVAAAVLFLASEAAGHVNGACLPIDGGLDWAP